MKPKTVLLVAGSAGFSTRDVWEGYREGLAECGVQVIPYATFSLLRMLSQDAVGNDIIGKAHDIRNSIDAVVFIDGLFFRGERQWVPLTLRKSGILTAVVKTDDPYAPIADVNHLYDVVCTNELASRGDNDVYLPTATLTPPSSSNWQTPEDESSDIVFVGTLFEDRVPMMRELAEHCGDRNLRLRMAGNFPVDAARFKRMVSVNLTHGTVRPRDKWRMYASSKLVINLFRESADAVSPSPRVFEVTAMGGPALLTGPRRDEVSRIFGETVYHFDDPAELRSQIDAAISDPEERTRRVRRAQEITQTGHTYRHRSADLLTALARAGGERSRPRVSAGAHSDEQAKHETNLCPTENRTAWIIGCGRSGSTWLCEMLDSVPGVHGWHEPYFGRLVQHLSQRPGERKRPTAFYFDGNGNAGLRAVRRAFYEVALDRYPGLGDQALIVKEVNTPELYQLIEELFPSAGLIWLIRDPFDVLDSYIDMRKPGSWNSTDGPSPADVPEHFAKRILDNMQRAAEAYEGFANDRKLIIRYEEMLDDPIPSLRSACDLVRAPSDETTLREVAQRHAFNSYDDTGPGAFRRYGQSGIWQRSGNFDEEVVATASSILGDLRARLGYT